MPPILRDARLTRRRFLAASTAALCAPAIGFAASRPLITHGVQSGDVTDGTAMVWSRADRPSRMLVEVATTESFRDARRLPPIDALPESDFTAKLMLEDLPADQEIFYRVAFQDLSHPALLSEPSVGRLRVAPRTRRPVSFVWSGDVAGQGWGIDVGRGGMRTFETMRRAQPDFFVHSGDSIYADATIPPEIKLRDGSVWRNIVTEEKSHIAKTLSDYRGNYRYNLLDANLRAFNSEVPVLAQWDDHEVVDDWCPDENFARGDYPDASTPLLTARARRAFHEYMPTRPALAEPGRVYRRIGYGPLLDVFMLDMRSYRSAPDDLLGRTQLAWLKRELLASRATWKVFAANLPLGVISTDAVAQGDGPPLAREREVADLLSFMRQNGIRNTIWITADMHYTAAHRYDPNRAVFQDFDPFWEFISGPLHAGTWRPGTLDNTFGPSVMFEKGCAADQGDNLAPCFGLQFFGHVAIDGPTGVMTVTLKDVGDNDLWSVDLPPQPARVAGHS